MYDFTTVANRPTLAVHYTITQCKYIESTTSAVSNTIRQCIRDGTTCSRALHSYHWGTLEVALQTKNSSSRGWTTPTMREPEDSYPRSQATCRMKVRLTKMMAEKHWHCTVNNLLCQGHRTLSQCKEHQTLFEVQGALDFVKVPGALWYWSITCLVLDLTRLDHFIFPLFCISPPLQIGVWASYFLLASILVIVPFSFFLFSNLIMLFLFQNFCTRYFSSIWLCCESNVNLLDPNYHSKVWVKLGEIFPQKCL